MERTSANAYAQPMRHVFVYGTLRRGGSNDITRLTPAPVWVGQAQIAGTLYDCGHYPGAALGGGGLVAGEVYAVDTVLERILDEIEEVYPQQTDEYLKREVRVLVDGAALQCLVYEVNPRYVGPQTPVIASGDWLAHVQTR